MKTAFVIKEVGLVLRARLVSAVLASTVVLAGCADDTDESASPSESDPSPSASSSSEPIPVLAATDVYGDIARQIGGDRVEVTSILSGESQDPHSYEATARDQLAVSEARVVIVNGGHYDEFMSRLLSASGSERTVLTAVDIAEQHEDKEPANSASPSPSATASSTSPSPSSSSSAESDASAADSEHTDDEAHADEETHADEEAHAEEEAHSDEEAHADEDGHDHAAGENEHVWYDLSAMDALAAKLTETLSDVDPGGRSEFEQNYDTFSDAISGLQQKVAEIRATHEGEDVAVTEIVAGWLLADCGLENRTPSEFSEAIEEGSDVPVRVLQETLSLTSDDAVRALIYNEQTTGPQTDQVREAAEDAGLPIVHVRETLPAGSGYLEWIDNTLNALRDALT